MSQQTKPITIPEKKVTKKRPLLGGGGILDDDINQFVGRRDSDSRKDQGIQTVDEVTFRLQQKRNAAEARKVQKREEKEKVPVPKWTDEQMNLWVLQHFQPSESNPNGEITMRDAKRMTGQTDLLIRKALKQFGVVTKTFPTHVYVLRDEHKIKAKKPQSVVSEDEIEFESE